ncbi:MAG: hypothetical protein MZV49_16830 [Rhodopseudomonas palustris]|nr:hypothetical protein [Rhodopseudomonas palustris]
MAQGSHTASVIFGQPCSAVEGQAPPAAACWCRFLPMAKCVRRSGWRVPSWRRSIMARSSFTSAAAAWLPLPRATALLAKALALCLRRNVLIITVAGARGCAELLHAAAAAPVLAVRAVEQLRCAPPVPRARSAAVAGAVPGSRIFGAALEGRVARRSGACSAAALVCGLAGVLLSRQLVTQGRADPLAVRGWLLDAVSADSACNGFAVLQSRRDIERLAARAGPTYPVTRSFG